MRIFIFISVLMITVTFHSESISQTRPSLQITAGLAFPGDSFEGDLVMTNDSGYMSINNDFIKNNYAASTGATVSGTLRFPIIKSGILSGVLLGSYTFFNAFRRSSLGTTIENNTALPVTFDSRLSSSTFAFGIAAAPVSDAKISPFINVNFSLNILSLTLSKNDYVSVIFNDAFRMGMLSVAGINYRIDQEYSLIISGSYHMSNLFLKSNDDSYADRIGFNRENLPVNDEEGYFYTNLSSPDSDPVLVNGKSKNADWLGINIGLSIVLGKSKNK